MQQTCQAHDALVDAVNEIRADVRDIKASLLTDEKTGRLGFCERLRVLEHYVNQLRSDREGILKAAWSLILKLTPWIAAAILGGTLWHKQSG